MLASLWLPIALSAVALFFASFLSWMVIPLHRKDWVKHAREEQLIERIREMDVASGSYMFPGWSTFDEMKSEEYAKKWESGPVGVMTVFPKASMGRNLGLTFLYFLGVTICLAYLATIAIPPGAAAMDVFRFFATAGLITFLAAILQHAIWFHNRVVGHIIESVAYAAIVGGIFTALWPAT